MSERVSQSIRQSGEKLCYFFSSKTHDFADIGLKTSSRVPHGGISSTSKSAPDWVIMW